MLLDVNVLVALAWPHHEHHAQAMHWFERHATKGWESCALTQAGLVRLLSQPALAAKTGQVNLSLAHAAQMLRHYVAHPAHRFLPLDFGFDAAATACTGGIQGHRQITDAYLLTLAIRHGVQLLTFDSKLASLLASPAERTRHIVCLS